MIDYQTYCQIHELYFNQKLTIAQIARHLNLAYMTVARWTREQRFRQRQERTTKSKLELYYQTIRSLLLQHPYTATQIFQMIRDDGYDGGYTLVKEFVRTIRPPKKEAYLTLSFEPAEAAQVDFGYCGNISIGNVSRRLSVFVMVLCYSRMIYLEFTLKEGLEHFLNAHKNAFDFFGGVPAKMIVDNAKVAVLKHPTYGDVVFHPRYNDMAAHYGCSIAACTPRSPHQKETVAYCTSFVS
jgi:transposase